MPIAARAIRNALTPLAVPSNLPSAAPVAGNDLHLTIDATLQQIAERELAAAAVSLRAASGSVVLLDPSSGALLALASWPTFDPNRFGDVAAETRRNRPVTDAYVSASRIDSCWRCSHWPSRSCFRRCSRPGTGHERTNGTSPP